jgi:hypothetical protein
MQSRGERDTDDSLGDCEEERQQQFITELQPLTGTPFSPGRAWHPTLLCDKRAGISGRSSLAVRKVLTLP